MMLRLFLVLVSALFAACSHQSVLTVPEASSGEADAVSAVTVMEAFVTRLDASDEIDSIATWTTPDGDTWVIATAKKSQRLVVFDGDSGEVVRYFGQPGAAAGEFMRPNGIAVHGDMAFVVERDNHRVQVLSLPGFEPLGEFGAQQLRAPYGIWLTESAPDEFEVYVTDSYQGPDHAPLPLDQLDERVRLFRIALDDDGAVQATLVRSFGDTSEAGAIRWIESIAGDLHHGRLLIPEEYTTLRQGEIRIYDPSGRFSGRSFGGELFGGEPEGLALLDCADGSGYWLAADQQRIDNRFHVFDRASLDYLGSFRGAVVDYTDGVALHPQPTPRFADGVFYAVHQDQGVVAFDWGDISAALGLRVSCEP